jgi:hypothetical protein
MHTILLGRRIGGPSRTSLATCGAAAPWRESHARNPLTPSDAKNASS